MTREVEEYIVERRNEGATLREISEELEEKFCFKTSQQNIHKFYGRWNQKQTELLQFNSRLPDFIEIAARVRYTKDLENVNILKDYSTFKLRTLARDNKEEIEELRSTLENQVIELYADGMDISDIGHELRYKGVDLDQRIVNKVIKTRIK